MNAIKKSVPMCLIRIDYMDFIMPSSSGMKVVDLMQSAMQCDCKYPSSGRKFVLRDAPEVSYTSVRSGDIEMPEAAMTPVKLRQLRIGKV